MTNNEYQMLLSKVNYVKRNLIGLNVIIHTAHRNEKYITENYKKTIGLIGQIQYTGSRKFGIKFAELDNPNSEKGLFYYEISEFDIINDIMEENNMKVSGNYLVAEVTFLQGTNTTKRYGFALFNNDVNVVNIGDMVLCDTVNGYTVGKVENILRKDEYVGLVTREIICKLDFSKFNERKENRVRKEKLKKEMDKLVRENQELALFQMFAEKNPKMKELLDEYLKIEI